MKKDISNNKFLNVLYKKRLLIFIVMFLLIIPAILLTIIYVGGANRFKTVDFGEGITGSSFKKMSSRIDDKNTIYSYSTGYFDFEFEFYRIVEPIDSIIDDKVELENGRFTLNKPTFITKDGFNENVDTNTLRATFVLQTRWVNNISKPIVHEYKNTTPQVSIPFNFLFPQSYFGITIKRPDLYVMLSYNEQRIFLKADLQNVTVPITWRT